MGRGLDPIRPWPARPPAPGMPGYGAPCVYFISCAQAEPPPPILRPSPASPPQRPSLLSHPDRRLPSSLRLFRPSPTPQVPSSSYRILAPLPPRILPTPPTASFSSECRRPHLPGPSSFPPSFLPLPLPPPAFPRRPSSSPCVRSIHTLPSIPSIAFPSPIFLPVPSHVRQFPDPYARPCRPRNLRAQLPHFFCLGLIHHLPCQLPREHGPAAPARPSDLFGGRVVVAKLLGLTVPAPVLPAGLQRRVPHGLGQALAGFVFGDVAPRDVLHEEGEERPKPLSLFPKQGRFSDAPGVHGGEGDARGVMVPLVKLVHGHHVAHLREREGRGG